jgi:hypothetical protein
MSTHRHHFVGAVVLVASLGLTAARPPAADPDRSTLSGFGTAQAALITWATDLFDQAALPLPPVDFIHSETTDLCSTREGLHRRTGDRSEIVICTDEAGPRAEFLVLHELAHAWDRHFLTDERRDAFLELRHLSVWQGPDPERWDEYGAEQAAEIVVWALMDRPIWPARITYESCADLRAAYETLTGSAPLHGFTEYCDR